MLDKRVDLGGISPTPVQPMDRLGAALGLASGRLWVKRDDHREASDLQREAVAVHAPASKASASAAG